MAKLTVTVAVILFIFAVAQAAPRPLREESEPDFETAGNNLLLPSEKQNTESETAEVVDWEPETTEAKLTESETSDGSETATSTTTDSSSVEITESEKIDTGSSSVTVVSFRPINRHFMRLPFLLRRGHRCNQHKRHRHHLEMEGPRFHGRDISYGNDMILSEEGQKMEPEFHDRPRQFPGRWMKFRNGGPRFPFRRDMVNEEDMRMHHRHHHHHHGFGRDEDRHHHEHDHEHEHEHTNTFVRKIRKFLTNF